MEDRNLRIFRVLEGEVFLRQTNLFTLLTVAVLIQMDLLFHMECTVIRALFDSIMKIEL